MRPSHNEIRFGWVLPLLLLTVYGLYLFHMIPEDWILLSAGALAVFLISVRMHPPWARVTSCRIVYDSRLLCVVFGLLLFVTVQSLNASYVVGPMRGLEARAHLSWLPRSSLAAPSWNTLGWLFSCFVFYLLGRSLSKPSASRTWLASGLVLLGAAQAMIAIVQRVTPNEFNLYPLTGSFAYENHFAAFINLLIPLALLLGYQMKRDADARGATTHPAPLFYSLAGIMLLSVVLSRSRAGMVISLLLIVGVVLWLLVKPRQVSAGSARTWVACAGGGLVLLGIGYMGREVLQGEFGRMHHLSEELGYRWGLVEGGLAMFKDRWFGALGQEPSRQFSPFYHTDELGRFVKHAHCDPVQALVEYGVLGMVLWCSVGIGVVRGLGLSKMIKYRGQVSPYQVAGLLALSGMLLHSLIDFPFHSDRITLTAALMVGLCSTPMKRKKKLTNDAA